MFDTWTAGSLRLQLAKLYFISRCRAKNHFSFLSSLSLSLPPSLNSLFFPFLPTLWYKIWGYLMEFYFRTIDKKNIDFRFEHLYTAQLSNAFFSPRDRRDNPFIRSVTQNSKQSSFNCLVMPVIAIRASHYISPFNLVCSTGFILRVLSCSNRNLNGRERTRGTTKRPRSWKPRPTYFPSSSLSSKRRETCQEKNATCAPTQRKSKIPRSRMLLTRSSILLPSYCFEKHSKDRSNGNRLRIGWRSVYLRIALCGMGIFHYR